VRAFFAAFCLDKLHENDYTHADKEIYDFSA
jgi:hypothetical protein